VDVTATKNKNGKMNQIQLNPKVGLIWGIPLTLYFQFLFAIQDFAELLFIYLLSRLLEKITQPNSQIIS